MFGRRGFTLVEMLFVVLIAAGALALALPSYKGVRERAKFQKASGMLVDLGSAVESVTRDLAMEGISVNVGTSNVQVSSPLPANNYSNTTLKQAYDSASGTSSAKVLNLLKAFGYLKNFKGQSGFTYYVGGSADGCTSTSGVVVACMKATDSTAAQGCFAGARYYKGGRFETITGSECN